MIHSILIDDFESTTNVNIGNGANYIDILGVVDGEYESLTDNALFTISTVSGNTIITLSRDNYEASNFPLKLTYFTTDDNVELNQIFNSPYTAPSSNALFALGKYNKQEKNVTKTNLFSYLTDSGNCYVKKSNNLSDVKAIDTRTVLNVCDKTYIDNIQSNYISNKNDFTFSGESTVTADSLPFYYINNPVMITQRSRFFYDNRFMSGKCFIHFSIKQIKTFCRADRLSKLYVTDNSNFFNGRNLYPKEPIFITPSIITNDGTELALPFTVEWYQYVQGEHLPERQVIRKDTVYSLDYLPEMVITADEPLVYRGETLNAQSTYLIYKFKNAVSSYTDFDDVYDFDYKVTYTPNDIQLN